MIIDFMHAPHSAVCSPFFSIVFCQEKNLSSTSQKTESSQIAFIVLSPNCEHEIALMVTASKNH